MLKAKNAKTTHHLIASRFGWYGFIPNSLVSVSYWDTRSLFRNQLELKGVCKFDWDPAKAASNERKHNVSFNLAVTIFSNELVNSIFDEDHSQFEERWISMGMAEDGRILVVCHTNVEDDDNDEYVRIISARQATKKERRQFESGQ